MTGHATPDQMREIESREAILDPATGSIEDVVTLALLYAEPAHREDDAIALLETAVAREPGSADARIWLAYLLLHVRMDSAALTRAADVLEPLRTSSSPRLSAAAHLLLAEIGDERGQVVGDRIRLLEASIEQRPDWVSNRQDLAWAYSEVGRQADAAAQLRVALAAIIPADPAWSVGRREFEESITGRTGDGATARLQSDLDALG